MSEDDEPLNEREALRKKVAVRLREAGTYADWGSDQVDGSLQAVIDAASIEVFRAVADSFESSRPDEAHRWKPDAQQWKVWAANSLRQIARDVEQYTRP